MAFAVFRLEKGGFIDRISQGIYVRPRESSNWETKSIGRGSSRSHCQKRQMRTVATGGYALNALGLSAQVPMNIVLLTDGSPREIKVGKRSIKFKKTTPKNLMAKGKISRLVIQALKEIGKGKVSEDEEQKIHALLQKEEANDLKHDIALAPVWIQKIMKKALTDGKG